MEYLIDITVRVTADDPDSALDIVNAVTENLPTNVQVVGASEPDEVKPE